MIDLRAVIASLGGTLLTVERRPPGIFIRGVYHPATPASVLLGKCSVQPGVDRSVVLPEGVRTEDTVTVYSPTAMKTAEDPDGYQADRFNHRGHTFEAFDIRDWSTGGQGQYYKVACRRVREAEADEA